MASVKDQITEDIKHALRNKDTQKLSVLRFLAAALKQVEVDRRIQVTDREVFEVFSTLLKQRMDSISQFQKANRDDLVQKEQYEVDLIKSYLPTPLSDEEILSILDNAIHETHAKSIRDIGKVLSKVKDQVTGRADMSNVSALLKTRLS